MNEPTDQKTHYDKSRFLRPEDYELEAEADRLLAQAGALYSRVECASGEIYTNRQQDRLLTDKDSLEITLSQCSPEQAHKIEAMTARCDDREEDSILAEAFEACDLTEAQQEVILLQVDGYSQNEIAHILGISQSAVRDRLALARKKLEEYFLGYH